jgi:hypothetical protein
LDMDCVTGEKAANARVTPKAPAGVQDTHDVKAPR